jgi:alkylation response protein AidB-like acyl-CoA dehydrogenase
MSDVTAPAPHGVHADAPPATHPCVAAARRLAAEVLAPNAERVDAEGVPASHIDAIKAAGLLGLNGPVEEGGSAVTLPVFREIVEILAGADCATWFVQAQHHSPLALLVKSSGPVRDRLVGPLSRGELLGGVAFAHLRRFPAKPVTATPLSGGGFRFDGRAPWCTGWGLNDVLMVGGMTPDGKCVFAYVPAHDQPGMRATEPLRLAALEATRTVQLDFDGLVAGPDDIVMELPFAAWAEADRHTTVNVNPAVLGLTSAALERLAGEPDGAAQEAAAGMLDELAQARAHCYRLYDEVPAGEALEERLAAKTVAVELMVRATTALVAAGGGSALAVGRPAQRLAREALFLVVQAQTAEVRAATLAGLAALRPRPAR